MAYHSTGYDRMQHNIGTRSIPSWNSSTFSLAALAGDMGPAGADPDEIRVDKI